MAPSHPLPQLIVTPSHAEWLAIQQGTYHGVDLPGPAPHIYNSTVDPTARTPDPGCCGYCCVDPAVIPLGVMPPGLSEVVHRVSQWWRVASGGLVSLPGRRLAFLFLLYFFVFCNTMV